MIIQIINFLPPLGHRDENKLQWSFLPIVSNKKCRSVEPTYDRKKKITENVVCAGHNNRTLPHACQGDSGGPLICNVDGRATLVGITSYGSGEDCGNKPRYSVFGRVSKVKSWIKKYM